MFKTFLKGAALIALSSVFICSCGYCSNKNLDILTAFSSQMKKENSLWVGTFQLVFNDMKNEILKKDVVFKGEKPTKDLNLLNSQEFDKSMLNEESYYTSYGLTSPEAKKQIEKDILAKFNEKSSILDTLDWSKGYQKYYAYAMLKKDFEFPNEFDKLKSAKFNNSKEKFNYFGINEKSSDLLDDNVGVLFYNGKNDYAVRLYTKNDDIVYLYRTDDSSNFKKQFEKMQTQSKKFKGNRFFGENDTLMVPNLKLKDQRNYKELCNKIIEGTDRMIFSDAIETIELELNSKGGRVKSEAALMTRTMSLRHPDTSEGRDFNFDKPFTMFLIDKGKKDPYLAIKVKNLKGINK